MQLPKAWSFPEWKSLSSCSNVFSICLTSVTSARNECDWQWWLVTIWLYWRKLCNREEDKDGYNMAFLINVLLAPNCIRLGIIRSVDHARNWVKTKVKNQNNKSNQLKLKLKLQNIKHNLNERHSIQKWWVKETKNTRIKVKRESKSQASVQNWINSGLIKLQESN